MSEPSEIARALLKFFDRNGVIHCVVGDTRDYLEKVTSNLDIVVPRGALGEMPRLISRFARMHDLRLVQLIRHEQTARYFVLAWAGADGELRFLPPDICSDFLRGGRLLLTAEEILGRREPATREGIDLGFCVPAPQTQFIYYLLKKVDKGLLDDRSGDYLSGQWLADPARANEQILRFWPQGDFAGLLARAAATNQWSAVRDALPQLRRHLHHTAPLSVAGALGELKRWGARVLQPTGLVVAVLGPDGCGKSTVIERMTADLAPAFRRTRRLHLRPRVLAGRKADSHTVTDPHGLPPRGRVVSLAKLAHFLVDYVAGYAFHILPAAWRSTLVVFDRYYHDLLVDPRRFRYGGAMALARWTAKRVPEPDLWVLLDAPAEVLQTRKREVPSAESERQRRAYLELACGFSNAAVVDASQPLERVVAEVNAAVARFLEQRLARRYPQIRGQANPLSARLLLFFCAWKVPALSRLVRIVFNSDIYCRLQAPILMPHPYGIVIHSKAVIGTRVTVMHQVTIGGK